MGGRRWTPEECAALAERWGGRASMKKLADEMGRSVAALKNKAVELHLGPWLDAGEAVTLNTLICVVTGRENMMASGYTTRKWLSMGVPAYKRRVENCTFNVIKLDKFWRWAEEHASELDFSRFEEDALGIEPGWAKHKRMVDKRNRMLVHPKKGPWTKCEDAMLAGMIAQGCGWRDICIQLKRSLYAIRRRVYDLYLDRPKKAPCKPWTETELSKLLDMMNQGYSIDWMARELGRSPSSVRGKTEFYEVHGAFTKGRIKNAGQGEDTEGA